MSRSPISSAVRAPSLPWYLAAPAAALGGYALNLATPEPAWWPAMFLGVLLMLAAMWQQSMRLGALVGAIGGAGFWLPNISWLTLYLGPVPWLALSAVMIAWYALSGLCVGLATRGLARLAAPGEGMPPTRGRWTVLVAGQSLAVAGIWVLREQVQGFWPYGGFAWGRLAHTQAEGPLAALVSWLGFSGFSGLLALVCAIPVAIAWGSNSLESFRLRSAGLRGGLGAVAVAAALAALSLVPAAQVEQVGTIRVAAVQGNSKSGIFDDRENGDVFRAHLEETERLLDGLEAAGERVDVIVWPENSAEFALPDQVYRVQAMKRIAARAGAPVVVGTILENTDGSFTNSTLVFDPSGETGARYDKRRPVPFAEYMPDRAFFRSLAPDLVDLVQLDYAHGQLPAVLPIEGASGAFNAAIAICFDIIFDDHAVAMMSGDGEAGIIFAQTNNADFGRTAESAQQLQIARLRAIESGRTLINISTVGTSAVVLPDGKDSVRLPTHTEGSMVEVVPLGKGLTPALQYGWVVCALWMLLGAAGIGAGVAGRLRGRRGAGDRRHSGR